MIGIDEERLRLTKDRVLLRLIMMEGKTKGGIYIPDSARKPLFEASVIAVGPEVRSLKKGDRVIYLSSAGIGLGENVLLVNLEDIEAKIEGEDDE